MASVERISIPQLVGENWSIWKAKFQALLEYKGLFVAIEQPESVEGRKVSSQARGLMLIHTEDAYVKLIEGEPTAEKAWKKLEDNFEKRSNARMIQLRRKLTGLRLTKGKAIAEYLGDFRELKLDLEAAGQECELAVHALEGLPEEYATLVEVLELGEEELTLDVIQPKLMQREQKLKLRAEAGSLEGTPGGDGAVAYAAKHRGYSNSEKGRGSSNELGRSSEVRCGSSNPPTCYCCGKVGHMKAKCRLRDAECRKCGKTGHTEAVCRQSARASGRAEVRECAGDATGVAFTAWGDDGDVRKGVWIVDSGSTQHVTADRSQFTSYKELVHDEKIVGICGVSLIAVGIGEVELKCKTPSGVSTVTLREVRHAPRAQANLFALTRATDAGARVVLEGRTAQIETDGVVRMEAVKRGGLWEIETVGKQRAFLARGPVKKDRVCATAKRPVRAESVVKKTVKIVEIDLDESDDEIENTRQPDETREEEGAQFTIAVKKWTLSGIFAPQPRGGGGGRTVYDRGQKWTLSGILAPRG